MTPAPAHTQLDLARFVARVGRRCVTLKGLAVSLSVSGWSLSWAQALDLAVELPIWVPLAMFLMGLG